MILECSQTFQIELISKTERKRFRRFLWFLMQWLLMQNSNIEFNIDTEDRCWFARQIDRILKDFRVRKMIAISDVDEDLNNFPDRYWDYRRDQRVWPFIEKDRYNFAMFSKEIDDLDISWRDILVTSEVF